MLAASVLLRRPPASAARLAGLARCFGSSANHVLSTRSGRSWSTSCKKSAAPIARLSTASSETVSPVDAATTSQTTAKAAVGASQDDYPYNGPLTQTFRRLKTFSLSSLGLTFAITPLIFIMETTSALPLTARFALAGVAIGTSGVSTALISWCGKPYVSKLRWLSPDSAGGRALEMVTLTLTLKERVTRVYDTAFLVPATRPFATWELAPVSRLPEDEAAREREAGLLPREETIAETMDAKGKVLGRWIVSWEQDGYGLCRAQGHVVRHFNVHQELMDQPLR